MKYFHISPAEIEKKLFNIFIGISLGNKLLTPELAKKYVKWAHDKTKDNCVIFIADAIDKINWMVFRKLSFDDATKKVEQKAYNIKGLFDKAIRELAKEEKDPTYITKVYTIFWDDIKNEQYDQLKAILADEYQNNIPFRKDVLYFVNKYIELRNLIISKEDKDRYCK